MAAVDPNINPENLFREYFGTYNKLAEHCFVDCVHSFTTKRVTKSEALCATNCLEKHFEAYGRITQKIQVYQLGKLNELNP
ncbi:mitochondrial import inner membrane translocase subunit Tim9-like [Pecten maximus]|uniref:mitochondrial import inner membrane translocase subunit Tim9-like n=1 Tax=Pecten maximus TaxID=6579 RepID=UPI0014580379|nr:mitochondrial import inner membrane translocase subunit Tim9-like [Pecten maximus]